MIMNSYDNHRNDGGKVCSKPILIIDFPLIPV